MKWKQQPPKTNPTVIKCWQVEKWKRLLVYHDFLVSTFRFFSLPTGDTTTVWEVVSGCCALGMMSSYRARTQPLPTLCRLASFHTNNVVRCLDTLAYVRSPTQSVAIGTESFCELSPVHERQKPRAALVYVHRSSERLWTGVEHIQAQWSPF